MGKGVRGGRFFCLTVYLSRNRKVCVTLKEERDPLYFELIGDSFDSFMSDYDVDRRKNLIFKKLMCGIEGGNALEVGCGTGRISESLKPCVSQLTVTDISEALAEKVAKRLGCVGRQADACSLPFESGTFDLVVSSECIEHTPDPRLALSEMARVLRKGGHMIVTTPNKLWYPVLWLSEKTGLRSFSGVENWIWPWTVKFLEPQGVVVEKMGGCHLFPWQIPLAKQLLPHFDKVDGLLYPIMINFGFLGKKM